MLYINSDRPITELSGKQRGVVRQMLGNVPFDLTHRDAYRAVRTSILQARQQLPATVRRGLAKYVLETHLENRDFRRVIGS